MTEAREMSMNSFRTHMRPPPRLWCDIGDEHGTMILAEFPVLFNYQDYMNFFGHPRTQWTGVDDGPANALAVAQIGAEHTEAMRRARLDAILPYMYAGWTRTRQAARVRETGKGSAVWKANYAAPESAAWHSSLSPVLASLDLFDANYRTGQEITTDLHLINDS